ncbi:hypothetical protein KUCAC02_025833 [Chaenocephalus aceratus]|uniref:Uncharacterized protein n=1 Tax=Chaenocephalus aceratus TaxID=36190 RepID=A0ACB9VV48_CHAAC|nr:hypothetical protein KUCAC02_025833 [Chaenocephalus aceratus]
MTMTDTGPKALKMRREIGLIDGVALVSGTMIGSGIFMSPQFVMGYVGSPGASLVIWAFSGVVAMFAALSYAELGTIIQESGGEFIYILRIYGSCPAFFAAITFVVVVKPFGIAAMAISIAEYALAPFYNCCQPPDLVVKCVAAVAILVVAIVNILNSRIAVRIHVVFLVAKVLVLTFIVIGGIVKLVQSSSVIVENLKVENAFKGTQYSLSTLGMSVYQGLWSYAGWYNLNYVTEELKRPEVNLPRAVVIAFSGDWLIPAGECELPDGYDAKRAHVLKRCSSNLGEQSVRKLGLDHVCGRSVVCFRLTERNILQEGHLPDILAMAHVSRLTPSPALIFTTVVSLLVLIPGDFQSIVNFFSFTAWIKKPELPRPYKVPIILPILVIIVAIFLVLAPILDNPQIEYLYVSLFILSGAIVYVPFIHFKLCPGLLTKLTVFLQLLLEVAPTEKNL